MNNDNYTKLCSTHIGRYASDLQGEQQHGVTSFYELAHTHTNYNQMAQAKMSAHC